MTRAHSPQDELYGPLEIPQYCWPIIDTTEFQRMRHIPQLGCANLVYPGATHTRFEHCLGTCHLAKTFMAHLNETQPELDIKPLHTKSVIVAALCHDLGHGPWSHCFEAVAAQYDTKWDHEEMSCSILRYIVKKHEIDIEDEVVEAACCFIHGKVYQPYPRWLACIVANKQSDIDIDKFDYLARDMNRSLSICRFEYDRLIYHCKVVEDQLAWKISEIPTIERMFYNRNDMHQRVYQHRVNQAYRAMVLDMLLAAEPYLNIGKSLNDPEDFCKLDARLQYLIELGQCGEEAQKIALKMNERKIYKCIGELRVNPNNDEGISYSQSPETQMQDDIAEVAGIPASCFRVMKMQFRYGLNKDSHPLLSIPFWTPGSDKIIKLTVEDISCIVPGHFLETGLRMFVTDPSLVPKAKKAFDSWKAEKGLK